MTSATFADLAFDGCGIERAMLLDPEEIEDRVRRLCLSVPPAFPLDDLVAVDPFVGSHGSFLETHARIARRLGTDVLPSWAVIRRAYESRAFGVGDLADVMRSAGGTGDARARAEAILHKLVRESDPRPVTHGPDVLTVADHADRQYDEGWASTITAAVSRFCAGRYDRGVARWRSPAARGELYAAWRRYASVDRTPEVHGLRGFRRLVRELPAEARAARAACLALLAPATAEELDDYLERLMGDVYGWAALLRGRCWPEGREDPGELPDLLTVRLVYDLGLARLHPRAGEGGPRPRWTAPSEELSRARRRDRSLRWALLRSWERALVRRTVAKLRDAREPQVRTAPRVRALFCIDVRSEPLRRCLEREDDGVETRGFAGFFGLPIEVVPADGAGEDARAQLPALLSPRHRLILEHDARRPHGLLLLLDTFKRSAVSCFSYVETIGLGYVAPLLAEAIGPKRAPPAEPAGVRPEQLSIDDRVALVEGLVAGAGLRAPWPRLLLLCGHDSVVDNNPQAAALRCGACRGHGGELNARLAAQLLDDPAVRAELARRGKPIPEDTVAVAAVHDTVTDRVRLVDVDRVPETHRRDLAWLADRLERAGRDAAVARAATLDGVPGGPVRRDLARRARDWSEVRPEWGLANNAGFIAARPERTRGVDLGGRFFLHHYDEACDPGGEVLELVLTAPVVVASWIDLQYYASTVAPERYGSGSKTLQNVSGGLGVVVGNEGDLAQGLSHQSVHDGQRERHEPLRLQVLIEARTDRIDRVLAGQDEIRRLVEGEWIVLHALERSGKACRRRRPGGGWEPIA